jgi:superfamily II DNA/RNA helicase
MEGLEGWLAAGLLRRGIRGLTPVQRQALARQASGALLLQAQSGAGKTLAYLATSLQASPRILIIVPTRELALQVHMVAQDLTRDGPVPCMMAIGGVPLDEDRRRLAKGEDGLVVATLGRVCDWV